MCTESLCLLVLIAARRRPARRGLPIQDRRRGAVVGRLAGRNTSLPVFALALGVIVVAAMLAWSILRGLWRTPQT